MTKTQAKDLFGGTPGALAAALGISPGAVSQWPEQLDQRRADQVRGAAVRLNRWPGVLSDAEPQSPAAAAQS